MRVNSVQTYTFAQNKAQSISNGNVLKTALPPSNIVQIVFTGGSKNLKQLASITPENNGILVFPIPCKAFLVTKIHDKQK